MRLILASASPRRAELLRAAGFTFDVCPVNVDERVSTGEAPANYVRRLAAEKATRATSFVGGADVVIIGADTAVVVSGEIFGKPRTDDDACRMLRQLSGRAHDVLTGVSVSSEAGRWSDVTTTRVWFRPLTPAEIDWYVASGEGHDKAGAYAIQGLASRFIPKIDGSYSNVVGLPIARVAELLSRAGC